MVCSLVEPVCQAVSVERLRECLVDVNAPIGKRMRSVFLLKQHSDTELAIHALGSALSCQSVLVQHEAAYALGQMQDVRAIPVLKSVLSERKQNVIVRHEAAEALGAIGCDSCVSTLQMFLHDKAIEVAQSCELALARIEWLRCQRDEDSLSSSNFDSVDPAPPTSSSTSSSTDLTNTLVDTSANLFTRYGAMFALRNLQTEEAVKALCLGLSDRDSALFRHEVAYVLGQLQHPASVPALIDALSDKNEHDMVRHEAAEALGAIQRVSVRDILTQFSHDSRVIVKESCEVALDFHDYWAAEPHAEVFQT